MAFGFSRSEKKEDFEFILKKFFKYNNREFCKIIISDECYPLINVLKESYPELF